MEVAGELKGAKLVSEQARRLWHSGADPAGLLDQRRFDEAVTEHRLG